MRNHMFTLLGKLLHHPLLVTAMVLVVTGWLVGSCSRKERTSLTPSGNAVYYWRTTFSLDSIEESFLSEHDVSRIYCRYFDVVMDAQQGPMPNATIQFAQACPDSIELVPVVFIMNDCMQQSHEGLAAKIVRRIVQMNETNDVSAVHEIQIDCDYTSRNRSLYYAFLQEVQREATAYGLAVSTTIRLHQLSMPAPPVSYGVLMLYNTGAPERFAERNPILDLRDVKPYLPYLKDYGLPLAAAYPVFMWQRDIHGALISHVADYDDIMRTKRLVEIERNDLRQLILTYHLDSENVKRYTAEQYEAIYHH